jgi:GMP synthase-like glutamine amidotransferase
MAIIVLQHDSFGGPGRLGMTLRDHAFDLDIRRLWLPPEEGGGVPTDFDEVEGVVSLGGLANVGEDHPWMAGETAYLREAHERQLPVVGVCLGHQILADALGGRIDRMAEPEWGFHEIAINPMGQVSAVLSGVQWNHHQVCSHNDEVAETPPGAVVTASSARCKVQAFRAGLRTYGFQFHFERDGDGIDDMARRHGEDLEEAGLTAADLTGQAKTHYDTYARLSNRLCVNLVTYVFDGARRL